MPDTHPATKKSANDPALMRTKLVIIVALMLIFALYFWGHNVEPSRSILMAGLMSMLNAVVTIGLVAVLVLIGGGIGHKLLARMDLTDLTIAERVAITPLVGLGIISLITLILGLLGFFNLLMWGVVLILGGVCLSGIKQQIADVRRLSQGMGTSLSAWEKFTLGVVVVLLVMAMIIALAPATGWDAIYYHLVIPQRYIANGAITPQTDIHFFGFPQNMEMLYGLLMLLTGTGTAPAVLHFTMGLLGLLTVGGFLYRSVGRSSALTITMLLVMSFGLWKHHSVAYVDLAMMAYGAIAIVAIVQWANDQDRNSWLLLAGVIAGLAVGIKYTAAPLVIGMVLTIILQDVRRSPRNVLMFGIAAGVVFLPWMIKGLLLYQNPIYPYLFGGLEWDAVRTVNFNVSGQGLLNGDFIQQMQVVFLPFTATIFGVEQLLPYGFTIGPFLLVQPFGLLILWGRLPASSRRLVRLLLPIALSLWAFWAVTAAFSGIGAQIRLMLVGLPVAAVLGGIVYHALEELPSESLNTIFLVQAAIVVSLLFGGFDHIHHLAKSKALDYHMGLISEDDYLLDNFGLMQQAMMQLETLPPDSQVLMMWEDKSYYCPQHITCIPDGLFDNWSRPIRLGTSPEELLQQWKDEGIDYILSYDAPDSGNGYSMWLELHDFAYEQNALFPQYFFDAVEPVWSDGTAYTLYEWRD
ncbi:MAG: glycosyltransferase family 39 protein [Anaerolineae bacterium]|nr:glycosyltransferase family 39 protein [Anaerolineae bacterium]